ncbi:hypothetical protein M3J09_007494 [Ascochyta lentis]
MFGLDSVVTHRISPHLFLHLNSNFNLQLHYRTTHHGSSYSPPVVLSTFHNTLSNHFDPFEATSSLGKEAASVAARDD